MLLHPHFIKFEKPKNELYLTFSAVVDEKNNKYILNIQKKIIKIVKEEEMLKDLGIEEERKCLYKRIKREDRFIYKYTPKRLHFSIFNFVTYNIVDLVKFEDERKIIESTIDFEKLKNEAKKFKDNFSTKLLNKDNLIEVKIGGIYLSGGIDGSLTLKAFPIKPSFFEKLKKITETKIKEMAKRDLPISDDVKIKACPEKNYQYFALNIFRFIDRNDPPPFNQGGSFYKKIEKINKDIKEKKPIIKMKPCIIISDPYLANESPELKADC